MTFCFGIVLPSAQVLAVRPRSIGIAETARGFVVSFLEAPMPIANAAMEDWAEGLRCRREISIPAGFAETESTARNPRIENQPMRIAVSTQNFRTITGHAGKSRRFIIYAVASNQAPEEVERLDLPKEMSLHEYHGDDHPLFGLGLDAVITGSAGAGFIQRLGRRGIQVIATAETDIGRALAAVANGETLPAAPPHEHSPGDDHGHGGHGHGHGFGSSRKVPGPAS